MLSTRIFTPRRAVYGILVVFGFAFLFTPTEGFAEDTTTAQIISSLEQATQECINQKDYAGAREKYLQVLQDFPDAIWSQYGLIRVAILSGDFAQAESEASKLLSNFANHPEIAHAVRDAADDFLNAGHYAEAVPLVHVTFAHRPILVNRDVCELKNDSIKNLFKLKRVYYAKNAFICKLRSNDCSICDNGDC